MRNTHTGFTLIELMIVVVIIGIIAAISIPSYKESVRKGNRADAKRELNEIANDLQRCFTLYGRFDSDNCSDYVTLSDGAIKSRKEHYNISISDVTETTYTLTATADSEIQKEDTLQDCDVITLEHTGLKSPDVCW